MFRSHNFNLFVLFDDNIKNESLIRVATSTVNTLNENPNPNPNPNPIPPIPVPNPRLNPSPQPNPLQKVSPLVVDPPSKP